MRRTTNDSLHQQRLPMVLFLLIASFLSMPVTSHANDYLNELEAEAKKQDIISQGRAEEISNYKPDSPTDGSLHKGLNRTGFEENLSRSSLGSYHMFTKLNSTQQEQVYKDYQAGASIKELRKKIKSLYNPFR